MKNRLHEVCFELAPEIKLPNNSRANIARGDPNARVPLEAVLRGREDHERHSNGVQVIVLVGAPWRPERIQQNKSCSASIRIRMYGAWVSPFFRGTNRLRGPTGYGQGQNGSSVRCNYHEIDIRVRSSSVRARHVPVLRASFPSPLWPWPNASAGHFVVIPRL